MSLRGYPSTPGASASLKATAVGNDGALGSLASKPQEADLRVPVRVITALLGTKEKVFLGPSDLIAPLLAHPVQKDH